MLKNSNAFFLFIISLSELINVKIGMFQYESDNNMYIT